MARYHVNPETGDPGKCKAKLNCPFGGIADHYDSPQAAREAFEDKMDEGKFPLLERTLAEDVLVPDSDDDIELIELIEDVDAPVLEQLEEKAAAAPKLSLEQLQSLSEFPSRDEAQFALDNGGSVEVRWYDDAMHKTHTDVLRPGANIKQHGFDDFDSFRVISDSEATELEEAEIREDYKLSLRNQIMDMANRGVDVKIIATPGAGKTSNLPESVKDDENVEVQVLGPKGKVEYYDNAWGGWRPMDAFGDAPTAVFPLAEAERIAEENNQRGGRRWRVTHQN